MYEYIYFLICPIKQPHSLVGSEMNIFTSKLQNSNFMQYKNMELEQKNDICI